MLKKFARYFVRFHFLVAFAAALLAYQTTLIFNLPVFPGKSFFFLFFATLGIYNVAGINYNPFQKKIATVPFRVRQTLVIISVLISIIYFFQFQHKSNVIIIVIAAIVFIYAGMRTSVSFFFKQLRNIFFLKSVLLSVTWSLATVVLPLIEVAGEMNTEKILLVFFQRFLFVFALAVPFDIRDLQRDATHALRTKTIPLVAGVKNAKLISWLALFTFYCIVFYHQHYFDVGHKMALHLAVALYISAAVSAVIIYRTIPERKNIFFTLFIDGMMILQPILVFAAHRFFS